MRLNLLRDPRARLELVGYYLRQGDYGAAYRVFYSIPEGWRDRLDLSLLERVVEESQPSFADLLRYPLAGIDWASLKLDLGMARRGCDQYGFPATRALADHNL